MVRGRLRMSDVERQHHKRPYYFPATVSLGNLINLAAIIIGIVTSLWWFSDDVRNRLTAVETKLFVMATQLADINAKLGKMNRAADSTPISGYDVR